MFQILRSKIRLALLVYRQNRVTAELAYVQSAREDLMHQEQKLTVYELQLFSAEVNLRAALRRANRDRAVS
jgi:hypothetical protein